MIPKLFASFLLAAVSLFAFAEELDSVAKANESRRETIRYGTDAEIAVLITNLENEKVSDLDEDLIKLLNDTTSPKIVDAIFGYLADTKKPGADDKAVEILENRDKESNSNVDSAIRYASVLGVKKAAEQLRDILEAEESRFRAAAARALGSCGKETDAEFLVDYLDKADPPDSVIAEIIYALGEIKSKKATEYLVGLIRSEDVKSVRKMAALEALGKISDTDALSGILDSLSDQDANTRAYAMAALSSFKGKKVEDAIVSGFRDSYYKVRLEAAKAAGKRKLEQAVPFLKYRTERDEVVAVREESIKALGEIGGKESSAALAALAALFGEKKTAERLRVAAARALLTLSPQTYGKDVIAAMDQAKEEKKMPLYHSFAKAICETKTDSFLDIARKFLGSGDIIDRHYGLDLVILNKYDSLRELIEPLAKDANASLARKARIALEP